MTTVRRARLLAGIIIMLVLSGAVSAAPAPVIHDGRPYIELRRVAAMLKGKVEASADSTQASLRPPGHVVTFTRNWSRIVVDGKPVILDAPVRVRRGVWLVPQTFMDIVAPRLTAPSPSAAVRTPPVSLDEVRSRSYPSFTRIVLEASGPLSHRVESTGPREARIRLLGVTSEARTEAIADGFVDEARVEAAGADVVLRVVFEGAPAGEIRSSTLDDPPRLVLDFARPTEPLTARRDAQTPLRTIVLDAGHGGHDSGAVGPAGLMEKDLVLDVTRRVAALTRDRMDVRVLLSRDGDHFVPLRDRTSFANRERADLFVSIHANAHREAASQGVETYFLSSEATDTAARQVAALENGVVQLERPNGRGRVDIVKTILWDLAQSEFQAESSRLAEIVLDSMTDSLHIPNRGVKQAGFYVLGGAAMPATLIEIGFVTNPAEERRLKDGKYREEIARAIFIGLREYKRAWDQRSRAALDRAK
jgi:N-acetylmuramoyl-L-alanine amidase